MYIDGASPLLDQLDLQIAGIGGAMLISTLESFPGDENSRLNPVLCTRADAITLIQ